MTELVGAPARLVPTGHRDAGWRVVTRGLLVGTAVMALVGTMAGTAAAAPGDTSTDTTIANVQVAGAIVLSGLTPDFTLVGLPGATVGSNAAVTMNVSTNNAAGYSVTVQAGTATMTPATVGNPDSIPIGDLHVRESAAGTPGAFTQISNTAPVIVHTQAVRSALGGDTISNDYEVVIPFVNTDTYSATLTYIATTL